MFDADEVGGGTKVSRGSFHIHWKERWDWGTRCYPVAAVRTQHSLSMNHPVEPEVLLTSEPLVTVPAVFSERAGGVVEFWGVVRGREGEAPITGIDYECHREMACHQLKKLAEEACVRFPVLEIAIHHRVGFVPVAEPSLFLRVGAAHRGPAFLASEWLIVELKKRVPIWKHPVGTDGREVRHEAPATT